jgi:uncharacterized protein with PIN domain
MLVVNNRSVSDDYPIWVTCECCKSIVGFTKKEARTTRIVRNRKVSFILCMVCKVILWKEKH